MANVLHKNLTGADLHEPKGADTAASGQVYVADGLGSGDWSTPPSLPTAVVLPFAGSVEPSGWLFCYGQAISRTTYATLFTVISTTFGTGDGSTTFNVPDLRGRVPYGKDNMGGSAANRITVATSGITGTTLGSAGGAQSITLATTNLPSHTHGITSITVTGTAASNGAHTHTVSGTTSTDGAHTHTYEDDGRGGTSKTSGSGTAANTDSDTRTTDSSGSHSHTVTGTAASNGAHTHSVTGTASGTSDAAGSGTAYGKVSPGIILNYIIYTGT